MPETPSGPEMAGKTEAELDNMWYEAFTDKVRMFGKHWPELLTEEEEKACCEYADSKVRRPRNERWDVGDDTA